MRSTFRPLVAGLLAIVFVLTAGGCAGVTHPATSTLSVEGKVAVYGRQLITAVRGVADGVDKLITANVIARTDGIKVLSGLSVSVSQTDRLANALVIVDDAKTAAERQTALVQVGEAITAVQRAINQSVIPIGSENARAQVVGLLQTVNELLLTIAAILPPKPPTGARPTVVAVRCVWRPAFA